MTEFSIETGSADDLPAVMPVMQAAFDPRFGEAWTATQLLGVLAMPGCTLNLARSPDVTGFALSRTVLDETELMLIAVNPSQRRRGIGRALIEATTIDARSLGSKMLFLEVREGNPATTLYLQFGFVPAGRRTRYYRGANGETFDAVTFRAPI